MIEIPDKVLLLVQGAATLMAILSLICRAGRMTPETPRPVRLQHVALLAGLAYSLVLPALQGKTVLAVAVMLWLVMSAWRWRDGDPTRRARPAHAQPLDAPSSFL